jgi:hypothetical protein
MAGTLGTGRPWSNPIARETVEAAITLGREYYLPHARAAFGMMGTAEQSKDADRVVDWLVHRRRNPESLKVWKGVPVVTKSELHAGVFGGSRTAKDMSAVCRLLEEHGYLRSISTAGRRDSQLFEIRPDLGNEGE